jgi:hypothetical protein
MRELALVLCLLSAVGCDDDTTPNQQTGLDMSGAVSGDMSGSVTMPTRMADVSLTFQPGGLWWDGGTKALYLANDGGQQIIVWDESNARFDVAARLPPIAPASGGLGQLIKLADGTWLVTRTGQGSGGTIDRVKPDGSVDTLPGLNNKRQRFGLTVASDGSIFDTWFVTGGGTGTGPMGGVSKVSQTDGETDPITGLARPIGVLAIGDTLYISDQKNGVILKSSVSSPGTPTPFATLAGADALAAGPSGTFYCVTNTGGVYHIGSDGSATLIKDGYKPLRGVAYDDGNKRLFVAEPDAGSPDGGAGMPKLHVLPIS